MKSIVSEHWELQCPARVFRAFERYSQYGLCMDLGIHLALISHSRDARC